MHKVKSIFNMRYFLVCVFAIIWRIHDWIIIEGILYNSSFTLFNNVTENGIVSRNAILVFLVWFRISQAHEPLKP